MRGDLAWGIAGAAGVAATLAVIMSFVARARGLKAGREFQGLPRPADLADLPLVTIVVPARNAAPHIGACLESLVALDYPRLEIIVVDDLSTDRTVEMAREISAGSGSGRDIHISLLGDEPADEGAHWVWGKSRALWHGAKIARGEWLLFVDADTRVRPDAVWRSLRFVRRHDLDALSMTGVSTIPGVWGDVLEAIVYPAIFLAFPWGKVNEPNSPIAWMNGQFILYKRTAYFAVGGHRAVAGFVGEDTALAILSKKKGVRSIFLPVTSSYESRDFAGLGETFRGWTRRLASAGANLGLRPRSYFIEAGVLFLVGVWPALAAAVGFLTPVEATGILGTSLRAWSLAQLGLVVLFQAVLRATMKKTLWPAVLAPAGAVLAIALVAAAYRARFITKTVECRGRRLRIDDDATEDRSVPD